LFYLIPAALFGPIHGFVGFFQYDIEV